MFTFDSFCAQFLFANVISGLKNIYLYLIIEVFIFAVILGFFACGGKEQEFWIKQAKGEPERIAQYELVNEAANKILQHKSL